MKKYLELFAKWLHKEGYYPIGNHFWQKENNIQTNISVSDLIDEYPMPIASDESVMLSCVNDMCTQSLSPDAFEKWESVMEQLKNNRHID